MTESSAGAMKICVISPRYSLTGVALAQIRLARALAERGHDVDMIFGCLDQDLLIPGTMALPHVPGVTMIDWKRQKVRGMFVPLCRYLRQVRPDAVFAAEDHLTDLCLAAAIVTGSKAKITGSSRVFPFDQVGHTGPYSRQKFTKRWLFKLMTQALMRRADGMTCVSEDMATAYHQLFGNDRHTAVHNIIVDEPSKLRMAEPVEHPWFAEPAEIPLVISAGTLTLRKGFVDLVRAVKALHDRGRPVRLAILGEGPMRSELEALVESLGLAEFTWLPGRIANPLKYFARSPVFVLSSYSEGLPNVLVEAMMCGCVPVATDCPTGPREVLQDGKYGFLVPMHDPEAMATAIGQALDTPIPAAVLDEGIRSFEPQAVIDRHFAILGLTQTAAA